jgi:hypothetical protein
MRASEDPEHTQFVQSLSDGKPIDVKTILGYKHLTQKEVREDAQTWKYAPVLVSTNKERLNIIRQKCRLWAQDHKTYVFKWKCSVQKQHNTPAPHFLERAYENNAFFWQYFVYGAPCNLNTNINADIALVNGTPATLHSLTFDDPQVFHDLLERLEQGSVPFGKEIEIEAPLAVNVSIKESLDNKDVSSRRKLQLQQLQKLSLSKDDIVIPLTKNAGSHASKDFIKYSYRTTDRSSPFATIEVGQTMPYDIEFSITVHKAQGRTLQRIVIDLTEHPTTKGSMEFAAVFVAMSRVRCKDHIRLISHRQHVPSEDYLYLEDLKPNIYVSGFYHGYSFSEHTYFSAWDAAKALEYNSN